MRSYVRDLVIYELPRVKFTSNNLKLENLNVRKVYPLAKKIIGKHIKKADASPLFLPTIAKHKANLYLQ